MTAKDYLTKAQNEHFAIGAFNAANLETIKAIIEAAKELNSPIIIEASHSEIEYIGGENFISVINNYKKETGLPIFTNLDHAPSLEAARKGLLWGFDLIHFNGSHLPLAENITATAGFVKEAHAQNVLVEAELDPIENSSGLHNLTAEAQLAQIKYTSPEEAHDFAKKTNVDTLATSFGSIHGLYETHKQLNLELLSQIRTNTSCFLSLHGGSDIPADQVQKAISLGIVKINVNSELRLAFKTALKSDLATDPELAIYKIMPPAIEAVKNIVKAKLTLFGSTNKI